ncbi:MAG: DNA repair protein RadC [Flavobacteriaceae bacterium]|nr:DNA repair protein RadC [Flavobacteriaceae bacterium]
MPEKKDYLSIKQWSEEDRPREKLERIGAVNLSNAELLAILLGSGNRKESAVALSKRILGSVGHDLGKFSKISLQKLKAFSGVGSAKATTVLALLELAKRLANSQLPTPIAITNSQDVFYILQPLIADLAHEEFWILYLNNSNKVIQKRQLSKGGITGTVVDIRLILKEALEQSATAIVLAHNHPSGNLNPSTEDKNLTQKVYLAAKTLDIKVLDHLIVASNNYFSFADEGLL